jgi:predicted hydrocarbon binding protein
MNQILESLLYEPEQGKLSLQGVRYVLLRPGILVDLQKSLETHLPYDAAAVLAGASQAEGMVLASRLKEVFGYTGAEVLRSLAFMLQQAGWGTITVEMANWESRELVFRADASPFVEDYGPSVVPVCHFLQGLLAGAAIVLFDTEVEGAEVQCVAKGDSACRFVVTAKLA